MHAKWLKAHLQNLKIGILHSVANLCILFLLGVSSSLLCSVWTDMCCVWLLVDGEQWQSYCGCFGSKVISFPWLNISRFCISGCWPVEPGWLCLLFMFWSIYHCLTSITSAFHFAKMRFVPGKLDGCVVSISAVWGVDGMTCDGSCFALCKLQFLSHLRNFTVLFYIKI